MEAEMKNALISVLCDIERRCKDLVCNMSEDNFDVAHKLMELNCVTDKLFQGFCSDSVDMVKWLDDYIKRERLKEYENEETEREGEKA